MVDGILKPLLDDDNFGGTFIDCFGPSDNEIPSLKSYDIEDRILAGDGIRDYYGGNCSVGFWARRQPNENFIATAGHCHTSGSYYLVPWNSTPTALIGRMKNYFKEPIDFGLINIEHSDVQPVPSVRNTDSARYKELPIKDIIPVSSNGAHLCLSGVKSHVKCGYVLALNGFTSDGIYFRGNLFVVNLRSIQGDSGGSIFSYKNLMD
ncbi:S1 family peptidase [Gigaspora margarita]|uniref:S1 family peptidase n=1 Tax=Gigaspora margarita TaxID=4874 RepID=A0A8H4B291_GIGMA|nr:S1 family peptidase [Gigaspora margarita]